MIIGTGIDIVLVSRMEKVYARHEYRLLQRILDMHELSSTPASSSATIGRWLAKRWAVKEAAAKALGTGFQQGVKFTDFRYGHTELGKPVLQVTGIAAKMAMSLGIQRWHVTVSDEKDHVIAMVIAES